MPEILTWNRQLAGNVCCHCFQDIPDRRYPSLISFSIDPAGCLKSLIPAQETFLLKAIKKEIGHKIEFIATSNLSECMNVFMPVTVVW